MKMNAYEEARDPQTSRHDTKPAEETEHVSHAQE